MSAIVKYNGITIDPPPFVSLSTEKVDYGNRWGLIKNYTLDGQFEVGGQSISTLSSLSNIFSQNFKDFSVTDGAVSYIFEECVHVDSISISANKFRNYGNSIGHIPYSVKLKSYDVTSGVLEPSDEWTLKNDDDYNVTVTHKVSARAVGCGSNSKDNAYDFVKIFLPKVNGTRIRPGQTCGLPPQILNLHAGGTIGFHTMILMGESESFDRLTSTLSVNQNFKNANTEIYGDFVFAKSGATFQHSIDAPYQTASLNVELFGSEAALAQIKTVGLMGFQNYRKGMADLLSPAAITEQNLFETSFKVSDEPNSNSIKLDVEFVIGNQTYADFYSGFFDYKIDMSEDCVSHLRTYAVNGSFVCKGNLTHRTDRLNAFINNMTSYNDYLYVLASDYAAALSASFANDNVMHLVNPNPKTTSVALNPNQASLTLSASFSDADFIDGIQDLKYSVGVELPIKAYRTIDSSTVNGHHVIQELTNNGNAEKISVSVDAIYGGYKGTILPGSNIIEQEIAFVFSRVEGIMGNANSFQISESSDKNNYNALSSYSEKKSYTMINNHFLGQSNILDSADVYAQSTAEQMNAGAAKFRMPFKQYGE